MSSFSGRTLAVHLALLAASWPKDGLSSAQDLFGFGMRGPALAGAVTALASGFESVYYNPAGLVHSTATELSVGYFGTWLGVDATGSDEAVAASREDGSGALIIGAALPIPLPSPLDDRLFIGLGLYVPNDAVLRASLPAPYTPQFLVVGNRVNALSIQAAAAVRITDWLAVGGGIRALARLVGAISVAPNAQGKLASSVRDELLVDYAPTAGLRLGPFWGVTAGLTYRGTQSSTFSLPIQAALGEQFPLDIPTLRIQGTAQYDPRQMQAGLGWEFGSEGWAFRTEAGVLWRQWSAMPRPIENTTAAVPPQPPIGAADTVSPRWGLEMDLTVEDWTLTSRLGYAYEPSPFAEQTGLHNLLDNHRHTWALGVAARWHASTDGVQDDTALGFEAFVQHQILVPRDHPKGADAGPRAGQRIHTSGDLLGYGIAMTVSF